MYEICDIRPDGDRLWCRSCGEHFDDIDQCPCETTLRRAPWPRSLPGLVGVALAAATAASLAIVAVAWGLERACAAIIALLGVTA